MVSAFICLSLLLHPLAQCYFFGAHNAMYYGMNRWVYFREKGSKHPLQQFHSKKADGLIFESGPIFERLQYCISTIGND